MSLKDFEIIQCLTKEQKGSLLKIKGKKNDLYYLLKIVNLNSLSKIEKQNSFNEPKILSTLKHPNIIEYKQSFFDKLTNTLNLVMDFPTNGNLSKKISFAIKNEMYLEESIIWEVLTQIIIGLNYLHKKGIIHRNLQTKNIYLSKLRLIKMTDFNCCFIQNKNSSLHQPLIVTSSYTAPELLYKQKFSSKCDIWSVGCIIYEMAALSLPFNGNNEVLFKNLNNSVSFKPIPDFYSNNLKSIIKYMLLLDPSKRPSTSILLNFPNIKETAKKLYITYIQYKKNINLKNNLNQNINKNIQKSKTEDNINNNQIKNKTEMNYGNKSKIDIVKKSEELINMKKSGLTQNKIKKTIKNATYRTLKQRKLLVNYSSLKNTFCQNKYPTLISDNNNLQNYHTINTKDNNQRNYRLGSFSVANTNINTFLNGKFLSNFRENNFNDNYFMRNSFEKNKIPKSIKNNSLKISIKEKDKNILDIPIYKRIFNNNKTINKINKPPINSINKENNNTSFIKLLKKDSKLLMDDNIKLNTNTDIQEISPMYDYYPHMTNSSMNTRIKDISNASIFLNNYINNQNKNESSRMLLKNKNTKNLNNNGIHYIKLNQNMKNQKYSKTEKQENISNIPHSNILPYYNLNKNIQGIRTNNPINFLEKKNINGMGNVNNNFKEYSMTNKNINSYIGTFKKLNDFYKNDISPTKLKNVKLNGNIFLNNNLKNNEKLKGNLLFKSDNGMINDNGNL